MIEKIIDNQPYNSFKDYLSKIQDKSATIALIKAGAFPNPNKMKLMQRYADTLFERKEYKPVKTYGTKTKLLLDWDIDADAYKIGKKIDKEKVLKLYNEKRRVKFDEEQHEKYVRHMNEFKMKYAQDEYLWEYESLSMFVTYNPLQEGMEIIDRQWEDVPNGSKAVVPCVISDIKRKKDKNNNQFAYLDLITTSGIIEATIWSKQFKTYLEIIEKGSCVSILGRKEDDHLFVEAIKPYKQWLDTIKSRKKHTKTF